MGCVDTLYCVTDSSRQDAAGASSGAGSRKVSDGR